jgi:hypothetical protein
VGRFARRGDLAVLALVLLAGAFADAAAMVAPFEALVASSRAGAAALFAGALAAVAVLAASASAAGKTWSRATASLAGVFRRQATTLVPLALALWAAHFLYHLATAGPSIGPALVRTVSGEAASGSAGAFLGLAAATGIELLVLDAGLLLTLYAGWRLARELASDRALRLFAPLALAASALWLAGAWILLQPMAMRGMLH